MTPGFLAAVRALRALPEEQRTEALHVALFWSEERLIAEEKRGRRHCPRSWLRLHLL